MKHIPLYLLTISLLAACALPLSTPPEPAAETAASDSASDDGSTTTDSAADSAVDSAADSDDGSDTDQEQRMLALQVTVTPGPSATIVTDTQSDTGNDTRNDTESDDSTSTTGLSASAGAEAPTTLPLAISMLDLVAEDRTFLEAISAARGDFTQLDEHRYLEVIDNRGILWQGEALLGDDRLVVFMQPAQASGQTAVRLWTDAPRDVDFAALTEILAQLLATLNVSQLDPDSFGLPDAEIILVRARETTPDVWNFDVRLNHPDTGWADYTDGWHVETLGGQILGVRILLHPHVGEMPFMRSQGGIAIPEGVTEVQVRSHDLVSGYGLETMVVPIGESGNGERYEVTAIE